MDSDEEDDEDFNGEPTSKYLFSYNGSFMAYWEIFIIIVAIINSITIPFQVFYGEWIITYLE